MKLNESQNPNESKKERRLSNHHLLPKSKWWANNDMNIETIKETTHRAIHTLFANQLIAEQLITTINISEKALREDIKQRLLETLSQRNIGDPYEWYIPEVIL